MCRRIKPACVPRLAIKMAISCRNIADSTKHSREVAVPCYYTEFDVAVSKRKEKRMENREEGYTRHKKASRIATAQATCGRQRGRQRYLAATSRATLSPSLNQSATNSRRAHPLAAAEVAYVFPGTTEASELGDSWVCEEWQAKFSPGETRLEILRNSSETLQQKTKKRKTTATQGVFKFSGKSPALVELKAIKSSKNSENPGNTSRQQNTCQIRGTRLIWTSEPAKLVTAIYDGHTTPIRDKAIAYWRLVTSRLTNPRRDATLVSEICPRRCDQIRFSHDSRAKITPPSTASPSLIMPTYLPGTA